MRQGCASDLLLLMFFDCLPSFFSGGTAAAAPPPFRPSEPALCGSCPLVTPYWCRLGDLLCFMYVYCYSSVLLSMYVCFVLFPLFDLSFVDFPSDTVGWVF